MKSEYSDSAFLRTFLPEGSLLTTAANREALSSVSALERAAAQGRILEAVATVCDDDLTLTVPLGCMNGFIRREEIAYSPDGAPIKDIAALTRVGRAVCFVVIGFEEEDGEVRAVLSRRLAQAECRKAYLSLLEPGDIVSAKITHMEPFGAFADIGCGSIALLPIDCISVSRISCPGERFYCGERIKAVIKSTDRDSGRIFLTHKELLGTWEQNASLFSVGQTVPGIVRSVEPYGIFVELTPNLAGLCEPKEGVIPGSTAAVYIKSIIPEKMKIKLVLVDNYRRESLSSATGSKRNYFIHSSHIGHWKYSPPCCEKIVETVFGQA